MAKTQRYKVADVVAAVNQGRTAVGASLVLRCNPETVRNYARRYQDVHDALYSRREDLLDIAEVKLYQALLEGRPWAITLTLRLMGKERGYIAAVEVSDGMPAPPDEKELERKRANLLSVLGGPGNGPGSSSGGIGPAGLDGGEP